VNGPVRQFCIPASDEYPITARHCQPLDWECADRPTVFCLCGCERQLCAECAWREFLARQERMAVAFIHHRGDRELVVAARARTGGPL